ncbi:hypothetical protein CDEST_02244 [Colletotrichum destructivum]|uniref:Uncharacterized protein n=1 Tax=Colletotrichum destructivum TaxID=34406 RepID=A0AAX4I1J4_9PEZI|nr:hypothetical protein CDEST_02244 [Colletotrichum destructivum]
MIVWLCPPVFQRTDAPKTFTRLSRNAMRSILKKKKPKKLHDTSTAQTDRQIDGSAHLRADGRIGSWPSCSTALVTTTNRSSRTGTGTGTGPDW